MNEYFNRWGVNPSDKDIENEKERLEKQKKLQEEEKKFRERFTLGIGIFAFSIVALWYITQKVKK
jgi:hypothetical protein